MVKELKRQHMCIDPTCFSKGLMDFDQSSLHLCFLADRVGSPVCLCIHTIISTHRCICVFSNT